MKLLLVLAIALLPALAEARSRHHSNINQQDDSTNFAKHFDEQVQYERDHPKTDDDGNPLPPKRSSSHRRSSHRKKPAPAPDPQ